MKASGQLRLALLAGAALLAGCSALQIDVDVYKGPLINEREIQVRQYAALARSAKPLLVALRKDLEESAKPLLVPSREDSEEPDDAKAVEQVKDLLCFYDDAASTKYGCDRRVDRAKREALTDSIARLKKALPHCRGQDSDLPGKAGERWIGQGRSAEGIDGLHDRWLETLSEHGMDSSRCEVQLAERHLTEALIIFAERMLFVVNNGKLFGQERQVERSLLQTLGNTVLVHANDLRRRALHDQRQQDAFARELKATTVTNNVRQPAEVVPEILRALDGTIAAAKSSAVRESQAVRDAQETLNQVQLANDKALQGKALSESAARSWSQEPLRAAYLTLVEPDDKPKFAPTPAGTAAFDAAAAKKDKQAIEALFTAPGASAQLSGEGFGNKLGTWLAAQDLAPELKSERLIRLRALGQFVANNKPAFAALGERKTAELLAAVRQQIDQRRTDAEKDWERVEQERKTAAVQTGPAALALVDAKNGLRKRIQEAEASAAFKTAIDARSAAAALSETLLKQAGSTGMDSPESVRGAWLAALEASRAGKDTAGGEAITSAINTVRNATLSPGFPFKDSDYKAKGARGHEAPTAMAVLDDVISVLRNRRVRALAEGKKPEAENLQIAIDAAYEQRASLVYIRPASDYLRNVYTATALQDENASPHRNMLLDYIKNLNPAGSTLPEARKQLEKVFWQNINRVSVSGGGDTNYVLAKDDVGNWYVKAYSSDTTQIFQSARNLFLFNSGRKLDVNLLERADLRRRAGDKELSETERTAAATQLSTKHSATSPAALDFASRSQERFLATYRADAQRHASELNIEFLRWLDSLKTAWTGALKEVDKGKAEAAVATLLGKAGELFETILAKPTKALGEAADAKDGDAAPIDRATRAAAEVVDGLEAGRRFRQRLVKAQPALTLSDITEAQKDKLLSITKTVLRAPLDAMVEKRQKSSAAYADSLTTLGDVMAAK